MQEKKANKSTAFFPVSQYLLTLKHEMHQSMKKACNVLIHFKDKYSFLTYSKDLILLSSTTLHIY